MSPAKKKLLLHICCAPCATYVHQWFLREGWDVTGYFCNPNLHPYREFERVMGTLKLYAAMSGLVVHYEDAYALDPFLKGTVGKSVRDQCAFCYGERFGKTASFAKAQGFKTFSSTLLASAHDTHDWVKQAGERVASGQGISFFYHDFRKNLQTGVRLSREMNLYAQPYCGCIFSEARKFAKP